MQRRLISSILFLASTCTFSSCATVFPVGPTTGLLIKSSDDGGEAFDVEGEPLVLEGLERGQSSQYSLLGLISWA
jgi:hypothetical protein